MENKPLLTKYIMEKKKKKNNKERKKKRERKINVNRISAIYQDIICSCQTYCMCKMLTLQRCTYY